MPSASEPWRLIGGHQSPYVAKVRAYLRFRGISFEEIIPSKAFYKTVIVPKTGAAFIPVLHDTEEDTYIAESSEILDHCEIRISTARAKAISIHPASYQQRLVSYLIELFVDEWAGIYSNRWVNVAAGGENVEFLRAEWAQMMAPEERNPEKLEQILKRSVFGNAKAMAASTGVSPEMSPALESRFTELCSTLDGHFRDYEYLLGSTPCLGDFALVGLLYLWFRDPHPGAWLTRTYHYLRSYVERCHQGSVRPAEGFLATGAGRCFLPGDVVPPGVLKVLDFFFEDCVPYLGSCVKCALTWKATKGKSHSGNLPRGMGIVNYSVEGFSGKRGASFYVLMRIQRALDMLDEASAAPLLERFPNASTLIRLKTDVQEVRVEHDPNRFYNLSFQSSKL